MRGKGGQVKEKTLRAKVRALDEMPRAVTSEEADLIAFIQDKLKEGQKVSADETEEIEQIYLHYFGPKEDDEDKEEEELDPDDVDEDDFA